MKKYVVLNIPTLYVIHCTYWNSIGPILKPCCTPSQSLIGSMTQIKVSIYVNPTAWTEKRLHIISISCWQTKLKKKKKNIGLIRPRCSWKGWKIPIHSILMPQPISKMSCRCLFVIKWRNFRPVQLIWATNTFPHYHPYRCRLSSTVWHNGTLCIKHKQVLVGANCAEACAVLKHDRSHLGLVFNDGKY